MQTESRRTPLCHWHIANGAKMVDFGGWLMPLWQPAGAVSEHRAVITHAGLFDTSHMSGVLVSGPDARTLLQLCVTRDLEAKFPSGATKLATGRSVYGVYLDEQGHAIDDTLIYQIGQDEYLTYVNAGMGESISRRLRSLQGAMDLQVTDLTGRLCKVDLQGPNSAKILAKILPDAKSVLDGMKYFSFKGHFDPSSPKADVELADGSRVMVSRSGYTGEFGFELLVEAGRLVSVWETILDAGTSFGLVICGLASRDSLRAGAGLPLSHQDIGPWPFINNPWDSWLPFNQDRTGFTKSFIGDKALLEVDNPQYTLPFVGNDPRKVSISEPAMVLDSEGEQIGVVLTCVADMAIDRREGRIYSLASPDKPDDFKPKGLVCGFVRTHTPLNYGETIELRDARRSIQVTITPDVRPDRTARRLIGDMM